MEMYERCDMGLCTGGVKCGVVDWVKINTLWWFDYFEKENDVCEERVCE